MRRILIIGGDSDFNLGDAAILSSLAECLCTHATGVQITITSRQPTRSKIQGITRVVQRGHRGIVALLRAAHNSDLVVLGGGGLFQDDDSRIKMPFWAATLATLKLVNARVVGHSLGAGPLQHSESRQFARAACAMLRSISVRDRFALKWLEPCTSRSIAVVPDPAFMLKPALESQAIELLRSTGLPTNRPIIGVALRRWFHRLGGFVPHRIRAAAGLDRGHGQQALEAFLDETATALMRLAHRLDASILMLPTYNVAHENDAAVCQKLASRLRGVTSAVVTITEPRLYKAVTGHLSLMIASRMHPLILASSMGTPVVGLAYNGKFNGLFEQLQLPYKPLWLKDLAGVAFSQELEKLSLEALKHRDALRQRTEQLAAIVRRETAALLETA